jgi:hypothetical protein
MTAPELRLALREVFDQLEKEPRRRAVDSLLVRAAKGSARWKPSRPSARIVNDAKSFAAAARQVGYADPDDVSDYLRRGSRAYLAGDHASARGVFEALLPPIAVAEIDLGQHELVSDVLNVDAQACVAQYVAAVYVTTPLAQRADAVHRAIEQVEGVSSLLSPIQEVEDVSGGALPDLAAFLPLWVKRLERHRPARRDDWEDTNDRWLREAVLRLEGPSGLERIARKTRRPQACLAWCEALADCEEWSQAFRAYATAAKWVRTSPWRGDLLDGVALAARMLRRRDVPKHLDAAWRGAPTLTRLLRSLHADGTESSKVRAKAEQALARCPKTAGRQLGFLRVLVGDIAGAAHLLSRAPGLGWSDADHPGHVTFALFAILLADGRDDAVSPVLVSNVESTVSDPLEMISAEDAAGRPRLETPSIVAVIQAVRPIIKLQAADRDALLDAMRVAAEKRVEAILDHSRRRHYGHAATLAAACIALAPKGRRPEFITWITVLQQTYSRRSAFRQELRRALESLGVRGVPELPGRRA